MQENMLQPISDKHLRRFFMAENYIRAMPLDPVGGGRQQPTFGARKALIRLVKSKIWSLIEKVTKTLSEGFRSPRRNELLYTPLLLIYRKKSQDFFRGGEAAKIFRAVIFLTWHRRRNAFEFTQNY